MSKETTNVILIKKSHILYAIVAILLFVLGIFVGNFIILKNSISTFTEKCKKFCEFIPDTEFSHVDDKNHCYCLQKNQKLYDSLLNKTLIYDRIVDVGIITGVTVKNYIE
ncbi:MAG: hypothetical protein ACP5O8_03455 [Candidatus Aenigmatarchaeota archaeon]